MGAGRSVAVIIIHSLWLLLPYAINLLSRIFFSISVVMVIGVHGRRAWSGRQLVGWRKKNELVRRRAIDCSAVDS